jgi:citrate lyase subunit beta/citryl-CoA lyase
MTPARSLLFVPADRPRFLEKALGLPADAILLDLEDGVARSAKADARGALKHWAGRFGRPVWVRVNGEVSGELEADLDAVVGLAGIDGIMLPKAEDAAALAELDGRIGKLERERSVDAGTTAVIAQIESALGVLRTFEIASTPRVVSVCIGGARGGDLHADLGSEWSIEGPELLYARQHVLLASRAAGIAWPLDGVFTEVTDPDGFQRDSTLSRRLGYRGRTVIHPSQVELANTVYAPSEADVATARRVLDGFAEAERDGRGTTLVDGRLVDAAMARQARVVIDLAAALPRID